jgi:hypothetical protein
LGTTELEKYPKCKCGSGMKCIYFCLRFDKCDPANLGFYCDVCSQTTGKHDHTPTYVKNIVENEKNTYELMISTMKEDIKKAMNGVMSFTPMLI